MKNSKKYFIITEAVLGALVLVLVAAMLVGGSRESAGRVAVIVSDSEDAQWAAFKYGLRMAARDRNIEAVIVATESGLTLEEQEALIEEELNNGADAVIVQPLPEEGEEEMLEKINKRVPVMLVGSPVREDGGKSALAVTGTDNYALGAALAEEILRDYSGDLEGKKMGLFSRTTDSEITTDRVKGLCDTLEGSGVEFSWSVAGNFDDGEADYLKSQAGVDFVAALDDSSLTAAGEQASSDSLYGALLYGIGHSTQAAYYVDSGIVECLAVPDEFNVGYQSMSGIADSLEGLFHKTEDKMVSYTVIRRETLFSKENQEILFTMSQ